MAVDELVDAREFVQAVLHPGVPLVHAGDEFALRFTEIGGAARVRQRGAERLGVGRVRQPSVGAYPQALLFDAAPDAGQGGPWE